MARGLTRRTRARVVAVLTVPLALAPAASASAASLFASPTGSPTATTCTSQSAPCSLPNALANAHDGDDLTVLPGEYDLTTKIVNSAVLYMHGLAGAPRPVIVDKPGVGNMGLTLGAGGGSLRHLEFQGASSSSNGLGWVLDANFALIEDVAVKGTNVTAGGIIFRTNPGAPPVLRDSTISVVTSQSATDGILAFGGDIRNVTVVDTGGTSSGLHVDNSASTPVTVTAENVIAEGVAGGVKVSSTAGATQLTLDHSYASGTPVLSGSATAPFTSRITAAPLLSGDFHELAGSPTIDAGVTSPANGATDPDGTPRSLGAGTDVGAYEFLPAPTVTTLPASDITRLSATLNGSVNPNDSATTTSFVIDTGPGGARAIPAAVLAATTSAQAVSMPATGLVPGSAYTYHLHAVNATGAVNGTEQTFSTLPAIVPPPPVAPTLSHVRLTHRSFRVGRASTAASARAHRSVPVGTVFGFTVSQPATVSIAISRVLPGLASRGRCVSPTAQLRRAHARSCRRLLAFGTITRTLAAGAQTVAFTGRLHGHALPPGPCRAVLVATNAAKLRSRPATVSFAIVR